MKPPYSITNLILKRLAAVSERIGAIKAIHQDRPSPQLRKQNQVRTIHNSLKIEGNTLSESQITAILEGKTVLGPKKDIIEVQNAIIVYEQIASWKGDDEESFKKAHQLLLKDLIPDAGKYRKEGVGILKGDEVQHYAPPQDRVPHLMKDLFSYLRCSDDPMLIRSSVFHYELEFIHPFLDGNGRMGRLWQTVLLRGEQELFEYLPIETLIREQQQTYYDILAYCDRKGNSTRFIEFMLEIISNALDRHLMESEKPKTQLERLNYFLSTNRVEFTRKDYIAVFKDISSATASRDLKHAVDIGMISKTGDKRKSVYFKTANE